MTSEEIEALAKADPDRQPTDDAFWDDAEGGLARYSQNQ